jgi:hypothetical protein
MVEAIEHAVLRGWHLEPFHLAETIGEEPQRASGGDLRIELPQAACGRVARIHELLVATTALPGVHALEVGAQHQHLAPDLQPAGRRGGTQTQRNAAQGAQVGCHVLPGGAVAPRRALRQRAVLVHQAHRKPVELRFAVVRDRLDPERLPDAPIEGLHIRLVESVVERQHGHAVGHGAEGRLRRGADAPGGRVRRREIRILGLERLQLAEERVEVGVGDRRRVEHVVAVVVRLDVLAEPSRALHRLPGRGHAGQENRRCAAGLPAGMPRASIWP